MEATITLKTKTGKSIEMTLDEARDLYGELAMLFRQRELVPYPVVTPVPIPHYPWWPGPIYTGDAPAPNAFEITCSQTSDRLVFHGTGRQQ